MAAGDEKVMLGSSWLLRDPDGRLYVTGGAGGGGGASGEVEVTNLPLNGDDSALRVELVEGATILLADGTEVALAAGSVVALASGTEVTLDGPVELAPGTVVDLAAGASVVASNLPLTAGGAAVRVDLVSGDTLNVGNFPAPVPPSTVQPTSVLSAAIGSTLTFTVPDGYGSVAIQTLTPPGGLIAVEGSVDGTVWKPLPLSAGATGGSLDLIIDDAIYQTGVAGLKSLRLRVQGVALSAATTVALGFSSAAFGSPAAQSVFVGSTSTIGLTGTSPATSTTIGITGTAIGSLTPDIVVPNGYGSVTLYVYTGSEANAGGQYVLEGNLATSGGSWFVVPVLDMATTSSIATQFGSLQAVQAAIGGWRRLRLRVLSTASGTPTVRYSITAVPTAPTRRSTVDIAAGAAMAVTQSLTANQAQNNEVAVSTTSVQLAGSQSGSARFVRLRNTGANPVYLGFSAAATVTMWPLAPGEEFVLTNYRGSVTGICGAGLSSMVRVLDLFSTT